MTPNDLLRRYVTMRDAQRLYFRDRTKTNLERAKALEAALDRDVAIAMGGTSPKEQPQSNLFP